MSEKMFATTTVVQVGRSLMILVPKSIGEMLNLQDGDTVKVPFLEIEKVEKQEDTVELHEPTGQKEVVVKIKDYPEITLTQEDVIKILENPTPELRIYRTAYIEWKGQKYGIKKVFEKLTGFTDYNTIQAESYFRTLGFKTGRTTKGSPFES